MLYPCSAFVLPRNTRAQQRYVIPSTPWFLFVGCNTKLQMGTPRPPATKIINGIFLVEGYFSEHVQVQGTRPAAHSRPRPQPAQQRKLPPMLGTMPCCDSLAVCCNPCFVVSTRMSHL